MSRYLWRLCTAAALLSMAFGALAANQIPLRHSQARVHAVRYALQANGLVQPFTNSRPANRFSSLVSNALGLSAKSSLTLAHSYINDQTSLRQIKYRQTYKGVPLLYNRVIVTQEPDGEVKWLHGHAVTEIAADVSSVKPAFGPGVALSIAKRQNAQLNGFKAVASLHYKWGSTKLAIWLDRRETAHLVYKVQYIVYPPGKTPALRPLYILDAHSGEVLAHWNNMQTARQIGTGPGGNRKVGKRIYGQDRPKLFVTASGRQCSLKSAHVTTQNLHGTRRGRGTLITFSCPNNSGIRANGGYGIDNDAHFDGHAIVQMYRQWYDTRALPIQLVMRVNVRGWANAAWNGRNMTFGNGGNRFYPLSTGLNVGGHEVSHGFTEYHSGLIYRGFSGGLNESFSDMAGETLEYFVQGSVDWYVGGAVSRRGPGLRSMAHPRLSDTANANPNQNVHILSGPYNRAFYLLSTHQAGTFARRSTCSSLPT